jgi:hypothetical protein
MAFNQTQNFTVIGEREVYINGVKIGYTKGGVEFTIDRKFYDITVDQYGEMPLDMALQGHDLMVKFAMAEINTLNLNKVFPEGQYNSAGVDDKVGIGSDASYLLSQDALQLRLHPRQRSFGDLTEDIYIWKAVSSEALKLPFKIDEQLVVEVTMRALVDENRPANTRLGQIGPDLIS